MIITDYNEMSIDELETISQVFDKEYVLENGKITEVRDKDE